MTNDETNIAVTDRESFIHFINLLREDYKINPEGWTNKSLDQFLEALETYTEAVQGYYDNTGQEINADNASWRIFSDILKGATMYE